MKIPKSRRARPGSADVLPSVEGATLVSGAEFLLSMVETHWSDRNGDARKLEVRVKAEQELAKIEQQIEQLQAVPGQNEDVRRQIEQLHERVDSLRRQVQLGLGAWERTEV